VLVVITAAGLADALTSAFLELIRPGEDRPVRGLELIEPGDGIALEKGDLVFAVGPRDLDEVTRLVELARDASGLVMRHPWVDEIMVQDLCAGAGLPLLAVSPDATWSAVVGLVRSALDQTANTRSEAGSADHLYHDLFEMADTISAILGAPVTIEDATSRVLAYSTGQEGVDEARMSTIVGRQVPREMRDHFRSLGVFRRLATSDDPVFVPAGGEGVQARYVVPIRAGGEWLGSVWAVMEAPVPVARARELRAATEVLALYLLRMRAQGELHRQIQLDQIRTALRGDLTSRPGWLTPGPWRVATLSGPVADTPAEARCQLWQALARRRGWRLPLVADIDAHVYVLLREEGAVAGSWSWLRDLVREESARNPSVAVIAGGPVNSVAELKDSRAAADELGRLSAAALDRPVASIETSWATVVLARAVAGLAHLSLVSPIRGLLEDERENGGDLVATLGAVIDYWGEPRRAAHALGVHPNTVRYRMARLAERCPVDLTDPTQRLALRLEIARARGSD
jgi:hypothetical protein